MRFSTLLMGSALSGVLLLTGCETTQTTAAKPAAAEVKAEAQAQQAASLFEVHHDGRINLFYDMKTYQEFLDLGESSYRLTRIGAGPKGETIVFGLPKADKKKGEQTPAAMLWDGKMEAGEGFYAEMHKHGRIYVFYNMADMKHVRELGHPNYMYTEIGMGPKGETVVFVLNKKNKKKKPVEQIAKYKKMHGMS